MKVVSSGTKGLKHDFKVELPSAPLLAACEAKLKEIGKSAKMPGFRPGKVPTSILRQKYLPQVEAEELEKFVNQAIGKILEDKKIRPASQPAVSAFSWKKDEKDDGKADVKFDLSVESLPEIKIPDVSGLKLEQYKSTVDDKSVDETLKNMAAQARKIVDQEPRAAKNGDVLNVDFKGSVDGVPFEGGESKAVNVELGGEGFIPGFAEGLVGMKPGDKKTIDVTFPKDYNHKPLAGKKAQFEIVANSLHKYEDRKVDDDLATLAGLKDLAELKKVLKEQGQGELDHMSKIRLKRDLMDELAKLAKFELPAGMVENEFEQIWKMLEQEHLKGNIDEKDIGKDEEDLKKEYRKIAERRVQLGLLLSEIALKEKLEVAQDDLLRAAQNEARKYPGQEKEVLNFFASTPQALDNLRGPILEDMAIDHLLKKVKLTDKTVKAEELVKLATEGPNA